jgi:hypothetical protein
MAVIQKHPVERQLEDIADLEAGVGIEPAYTALQASGGLF